MAIKKWKTAAEIKAERNIQKSEPVQSDIISEKQSVEAVVKTEESVKNESTAFSGKISDFPDIDESVNLSKKENPVNTSNVTEKKEKVKTEESVNSTKSSESPEQPKPAETTQAEISENGEKAESVESAEIVESAKEETDTEIVDSEELKLAAEITESTENEKSESETILTDEDIYDNFHRQRLPSSVIAKTTKPKDVLEFSDMINDCPTVVIFSHDWGSRFVYIGMFDEYSRKTLENINKIDPDTVFFKDKTVDAIYNENKPESETIRGINWLVYDCCHTGQGYDERCIREYYPDEAESIISKRNEQFSSGDNYYSFGRCMAHNDFLIEAAKTIEDVGLRGYKKMMKEKNGAEHN